MEPNPASQLSEYERRHLAGHLATSDRASDLHRLLRLETDKATNAWYEAKAEIDDLGGFVADIELAWQLAEQSFGASQSAAKATSVALQCRYALIFGSLNSQAQKLPPALLAAHVERREWSLRRALATARQIPGERQRADSLLALVPRLQEPAELTEFLTTARTSLDEPLRAEVLAALAPRAELGETLLQDAREFSDTTARATLLQALCPVLDESLAGESLAEVLTLSQPARGRLLVALAPALSMSDLEVVLVQAEQTEDIQARGQILQALAPRLTGPMLKPAVTLARGLPPGAEQAELVIALSARLPDAGARGLLQRTRRRLLSLKPGFDQAVALARLGDTGEALKRARAIDNAQERARALAALAPWLSPVALRQLLKETAKLRPVNVRAEVLAVLAPHLPESQIFAALKQTDSIRSPADRAEVLLALAPHLPERRLTLALNMALAVKNVEQKAKVLTLLAPRLSDQQLERALKRVWRLRKEGARGQLLAVLVPQLAGEQRQVWIQRVERLSSQADQKDAVQGLVSQLPDETAGPLGEAVSRIADGDSVALTRAVCSEGLSDHELAETFAAVAAIGDEETRWRALASLAPQLPRRLSAEALIVLLLRDATLASDREALQEGRFAQRASKEEIKASLAAEIDAYLATADATESRHLIDQRWKHSLAWVTAGTAIAQRLSGQPRRQLMSELGKVVVQAIEASRWPWTGEATLNTVCALPRALQTKARKAALRLVRASLRRTRQAYDSSQKRQAEYRRQQQYGRIHIWSWEAPGQVESDGIAYEFDPVKSIEPQLAEYDELPGLLARRQAYHDCIAETHGRNSAFLVPYLAELGRIVEATKAIDRIEQPYWQVQALASSLRNLPSDEREAAARRGLELAAGYCRRNPPVLVDDEWIPVHALGKLASSLPGDQVAMTSALLQEWAQEAIDELPGCSGRKRDVLLKSSATAAAELAAYLARPQQRSAWDWVKQTLAAIEAPDLLAEALSGVACHCPRSALGSVNIDYLQSLVMELPKVDARDNVREALARRLVQEGVFRDALSELMTIDQPALRTSALEELVAAVSSDRAADPWQMLAVESRLLHRLAEGTRAEAFASLQALAPILGGFGPEAASGVGAALVNVSRWWA